MLGEDDFPIVGTYTENTPCAGDTRANVAGFRLIVRPMVFHPRYFLTSAFFARFLLKLDLSGKRVADVGTGSGILALAAAQAGAGSVLALDINPNAAQAAAENAHASGFGGSIRAVVSNLLSAVTPRPLFDVILSSPPSFAGEPRDLADRAWHAGPNPRDVVMLFAQARERLASDGCMYLLLSTDSDLGLLGTHIRHAGFAARLVADRNSPGLCATETEQESNGRPYARARRGRRGNRRSHPADSDGPRAQPRPHTTIGEMA